MVAPTIFLQLAGKKICIDAIDVCRVEEADEGTVITYVVVESQITFATKQNFQSVLSILAEKIKAAEPRTEGEGWKDD